MRQISMMGKSSLLGLFGGASVLAVAATVSHQHLSGLFNFAGLFMVAGGTLAATLVSRPARDVLRVLRGLPKLMHDENIRVDADIDQLLNVAQWHRIGNIAATERAIEHVGNPLLRAGAQLVVDRQPIEDIIKLMQWRLAAIRTRDLGDAQILRSMATFAPAFGMLGTLFGLIQMLGGLESAALSQIGTTMSFALVTTLYGLVLANMALKPLAIKMERRVQQRLVIMNVFVEGVVLLHERRHPTVMREALAAYLMQHQHHMHAANDGVLEAA